MVVVGEGGECLCVVEALATDYELEHFALSRCFIEPNLVRLPIDNRVQRYHTARNHLLEQFPPQHLLNQPLGIVLAQNRVGHEFL